MRTETELEIRDMKLKMRSYFEAETKGRRREAAVLEKRLMQRSESLDRKVDLLDDKEKRINERGQLTVNKERQIEKNRRNLEQLLIEEKERLQRITRMSTEDAKKELLARIKNEVRQEAGAVIRQIEEETKEAAEKKSRNIISLAMQRCAAEHTVESAVSVVSLPNDEMKGRIIGREGRNIRALEMATGVDVRVDDTP